jgi:hypothetical protein
MSKDGWTRWGARALLALCALTLIATVRGALRGPNPSAPSSLAEKGSVPGERSGSIRPGIAVAAERDPFQANRHRAARYRLPSEAALPEPAERLAPSAPELLVFGTVQTAECGTAIVAPTKGASPRLISCGDQIGGYVLAEVRLDDILVRDSLGTAFTIPIAAMDKRQPDLPAAGSALGNVSPTAEIILDGVAVANKAVLNTLDPSAIERVEIRKFGGRDIVAVTTKKIIR